MSSSPSFFCRLLTVLGVRHTDEYSCRRFKEMPFKSLFGLKNLLREYGVESLGVRLADKTEITSLPLPFVAPVKAGEWVTVTSASANTGVRYCTAGVPETASLADFTGAWSGVALIMRADAKSSEPDWAKHRFKEIMVQLRDYGLWLCVAALFLYCFVSNGLYRHVSTVGLVVFDLIGLAASFMLVQKTVGVHTKAAAHVCGVIEKEGCDTVLKTAGSTFFGIFHWSEVGMGYFGVSLLALLVFPESLPQLALFNACCLPYTLWSVTYQRFRAKAWCTLCLTVQATLWVLFFFCLGSGAWHGLMPLFRPALFVLPLCYVAAVTGLNKLLPMLKFTADEPDKNS